MELCLYKEWNDITKFAYWYNIPMTHLPNKVTRYLVMDFRRNHRIRGILNIAVQHLSKIFHQDPEEGLYPGVHESVQHNSMDTSAIEKYFKDDSMIIQGVLVKLFSLRETRRYPNAPYQCYFYTVYLEESSKTTYYVPLILWQQHDSKAFLKAIGRLRKFNTEIDNLYHSPNWS